MMKILQVAWREIHATVVTKGFIIGVLITPALLFLSVQVFSKLHLETPPRIVGEVAILDPTQVVAEGAELCLTPNAFALRRAQDLKLVDKNLPVSMRKLVAQGGMQTLPKAVERLLGEVPEIHFKKLADSADLEKEKQPLLDQREGPARRLALIVIHPDAVQRAVGKEEFGTYHLFVREKLDDRVEGDIKSAVRESIIAARAKASGLNPKEVERLTNVSRVESTRVTLQGDQKGSQSHEVAAVMAPFAFMFLIFVSVMTASQYLMTTTIEEKSSRIAEVLLSAVSPMQLMAGKILGQFVVGLTVLLIYLGLGLVALVSFAMLGLIDLSIIFYLFLFYLVSFFTYAALLAAVGASVNEIREAQSLMMPVMLTMMLPMFLWMPVSRDPSSSLALVLSMVPPVNSFFMLIRMASSTPPPLWQVWGSIALGVAGAYAAVWSAAKIFRIGLLMHGKPPDFRTLVRWVRMA
jgi:ABC-2 type transport system permease protein